MLAGHVSKNMYVLTAYLTPSRCRMIPENTGNINLLTIEFPSILPVFCISLALNSFIMGDSDDEYDRKRRDKFRGERTESYSREGRRDDRRRDDWVDR